MKKQLTRIMLAALVLSFGASMAISRPQNTSAAKPAKPAPATASAPASALLDINTATKEQLDGLSGIGAVYSQKIIDGRPYARKDQLVQKKIIPQATYDKIKDKIIAKKAATADKTRK